MMVLVSYDVNTQDRQGQKRLRKIARLCENWGQRVQYSVFECLVEPAQWTALRASLIDNIDQEKDPRLLLRQKAGIFYAQKGMNNDVQGGFLNKTILIRF